MKRRRFNPNPLHEKIPKELTDTLRKSAAELLLFDIPFIVIGGLALTYHFPPYPTEDVDYAFMSEDEAPKTLSGLKRLTRHMFEDKNGVIVDIVTPEHTKVPQEVFDYAFATAQNDESQGMPLRFAAPLAIFALKLSSARQKDKTHLLWMMRHGFHPRKAELLACGVKAAKMELLDELRRELQREFRKEKEMGW